MAWEMRGKTRYYYQARREGGRVIKTYLGSGDSARQAAQATLDAQQSRDAERQAVANTLAELEPLDRLMDGIDQMLDFLTGAALEHAGYRVHKGSWRRPRASAEGRTQG